MATAPAIHRSITTSFEVEDEQPDAPKRVTTLELFFDLVFVFTLTQLTALLADALNPLGFARVLLIFGVSWWMYGGYVWLTNHLELDRPVRRLLLLLAMGAFLVQALSIPHAFDSAGVAFGVAYLVVVLVHAALFWSTQPAIARTAAFNVLSAALVIGAGFVDGAALRFEMWTLALAVQVVTPFIAPIGDFRLRPGHFIERHGLLMLVAFGESVVSIGIGAEGLPVDAELIAAAVLGLALIACLWWSYFAEDDERAEHAMAAAAPERRPALAIHAFFYAHIPMLLGVVCLAVGIKKALSHPLEPLAWAPAMALGGGVALYLAGDVLFRRILRIGRGRARAGGAAAALAAIPLGLVSAALQLGTLVLLFVAMFVMEARTAASAEWTVA